MENLAKIKNNLEAKLEELTGRVSAIEEDLRQPHDDDWSEDATESQNDETLEGVENIAIQEIGKIKIALSKIEKGTYGKCAQCGKPIAIKRLEALPYAINCVGCTE